MAHRPEPWWHPLRSDPGLAEGLNVWVHLLAIVLTLIVTVVLGFALGISATPVALLSVDLAAVFSALGLVLVFSVLFSWAGHLPGALVLNVALRRGRGGWLVAMAGGLVIGMVLSTLIGSGVGAIMGPFLALLHLVILRCLASLFRPAHSRIGNPEESDPV